jgi:hypothetical protein
MFAHQSRHSLRIQTHHLIPVRHGDEDLSSPIGLGKAESAGEQNLAE